MKKVTYLLPVSLLAFLCLACNPGGGGSSSTCGDGIIEGSEECDTDQFGANTCLALGYYGGSMVCTDACRLDRTSCEAAGRCGDGIYQDAFEECEGDDVFGATCESLGYPSGTISCRDDCKLDVTNCEGSETCGDSLIQAEYEECELYDLNYQTCESLGYYGTGLACDDRCHFDLTICQLNGMCGDGVTQVLFEDCDGTDLAGETCEGLGYYGGTLACAADCTADVTDCAASGFCGDLIVQPGYEECDGVDMGIYSCAGQTDYYTDGTPTCLANCTVDYAGCGRCGDGVLQAAHEECDGQDLGSATCREFGYFGGTSTGCESDCTAMGCGNLTVIDGGQYHTCAADDAGNAWCWGYNNHGQLGNGTTSEERAPVRVSGLSDVVHISAGREHSCAVTGSGEVWCWGNNSHGQLGNGNTTDQSTPVQVIFSGGSAVYVSCGTFHSCLVTSTGSAWCWGDNTSGKLGDGSSNESHWPVQVGTVNNLSSISAGENHTCGTQNGGQAWCWGNNYSGQLGDGTTDNTFNPHLVSGISFVTSISAGNNHSCATVSSGETWCWGDGGSGKLGDGHTLQRITPVQVSSITGAVWVSVGTGHSCAMLTNGALHCWGSNANGRLGDGTTTDRLSPVQVLSITTATWLGLGDTYSCAGVADGMGYCWGFNFHGQLGDGSAAQATSPSMVAEPQP